jgi:hypothetical protein
LRLEPPARREGRRRSPDALDTKAIDHIKVRMLLDEALERGIGDARRIEAWTFGAWAICAVAAQRIEPVAGFNQQGADLGAGKSAL